MVARKALAETYPAGNTHFINYIISYITDTVLTEKTLTIFSDKEWNITKL